jgi:ectoine hydroxylase-related dioxygenase (phytanoyl-CoA dioxygenase family)
LSTTVKTQHDLDDYLFDLNGYLIIQNAIDAQLLADLNAAFDAFPELEFKEWWGEVQRLDNNARAGVELQNIVAGGKPFETLIDHPSWIDKMRRYCGEHQTWIPGLFIDECFATIRRTGGFFALHSGGHERAIRNQYGYADGKWQCGQVNILLALTDIGPGDGGTRIIPGSHKSNFAHPVFERPYNERFKDEDENVAGSITVTMKAGDALLFSDAVSHGAARRTNPGERRAVIYRYGPGWGRTRYGFEYSQTLLDRVTPAQREILQPIPRRVPGTDMGLGHD